MVATGGTRALAACVPPSCNDANVCTTDICLMDNCLHIAQNCDDGDACTIDDCNPTTGSCTHAAILCGDNDACTLDLCNSTSGCNHFPILCSNPSGCTTAHCDPALGCVVESICSDQNVCTTDACNTVTGSCEFTPIPPCNDNDPCTNDLCDTTVGCRFLPNFKCIVVSPLTLKALGTVSSMSFKRKGGTSGVKITLQDSVLTSQNQELVREKVKLKAVLTGADADIASLLYPVLALGTGAGALDALHAQGYDVSVVGDPPSCQQQLPAETCTKLALQLSKAIDSTLALGDIAERDAFRQAAQTMGYPPDDCVFIP